ncbi:hypothetical protein [Desulfocastanea catecholica]
MIRIFALILFLGLTGCAGSHKVGGSFVGQLPQEGVVAIADDATSYLTSLYPPGHTSINLVTPQQSDAFSRALETNLRQKGFTLSGSGTVTMSYVLDTLHSAVPPVWYLQLRIVDTEQSKTIARSYTANGYPAAGFSILSTGGDHGKP